MTYNDYYKLREQLKLTLDKLYKQGSTMEEFYSRTEMSSVKKDLTHLNAVISNIEEAVNNLDYFVYFD